MFVKRAIVTLILLPIGLVFVYLGGWAYVGLIAVFTGVAAWEYGQLFHAGGFQPAGLLVIAGTVLLVLDRAQEGLASSGWLLSLLILAAMTVHLVAFERGRDLAATDFAITLAGILYLGWIGAFLVSLRSLPEGMGWLLTALPAVWVADSGAYLIGSRWGRHRLSPRLSPKKSWEGFWAGVVTGLLSGVLFGWAWNAYYGPTSAITPLRGALLGLVLSSLSTLGDLGESMIKRQVGVKDSSHLIPGHGGFFDRIDSWLWAGVIGYYLIALGFL